MKTILQILRLNLWTLPVQRVLLVLGLGICIGAFITGRGASYAGMQLATLLPVLLSGVFLRQITAPRQARLWPHARGKLLLGLIATLLLVAVAVLIGYGLDFLRAPPRFQPKAEGYVMLFVLSFSFWTMCCIGMFVASRGPAWALLVIAFWLLPGMALRAMGVDDIPRLMTGQLGIATSLVAWALFAVWFLRVREVSGAGWRWRSNAMAMEPNVMVVPASREQAMRSWVLNAGTPWRIGMQWGLAAVVLISVQLLLPYLLGANSPGRSVMAMIFATLSLAAAAVAALTWSMAKRSRWLWLTAGHQRLQLFGWCERLMLKIIVAIGLPLALLATAVWFGFSTKPTVSPLYLALALLAPMLGAGWFGLMQVHRRIALDGVAALLLLLGWYAGLVQPLYSGASNPRWEILFAQFGLVVLLREVAYVRWRSADWPRTGVPLENDR